MSIKFSLLHATYGRPKKAIDAMLLALKNARHPENVEYIFACNDDDDVANLVEVKCCAIIGDARCIRGPFIGSAAAWDAAAKVSTGDILVQMSDDLELPQDFDMLLIGQCAYQCGPKWNDRPSYIAVSDGFRRDSLCTCAVMNRKYYEFAGHFIPPEYTSVHSDGEVTYRAKLRSQRGEANWIDAKCLTFLHRHHYNDKTVKWDETYARGNAPEAYAIGRELFFKRNPGAINYGLVDWL